MKKIDILGTKISLTTKAEVLGLMDKGAVIVTPNPEFVLLAREDREFQGLLNRADVAICDGVGLRYAAWYLGRKLPKRFTGSDLMLDIMAWASQNGRGVFGICADGGLSGPREIIEAVRERFPKLDFSCQAFTTDHALIATDQDAQVGEGVSKEELLGLINDSGAHVVVVGLGQREQERWIFENKDRLPRAKVFIGVGGSFDFLTGKTKRAPRAFRFLGLEWLWRMLIQPRRAGRIWRAFVVFALTVTFSRFRKSSQNMV